MGVWAKEFDNNLRPFWKNGVFGEAFLIVWIVSLIRDEYATKILFWFGDRYGERMEQIIRIHCFRNSKECVWMGSAAFSCCCLFDTHI